MRKVYLFTSSFWIIFRKGKTKQNVIWASNFKHLPESCSYKSETLQASCLPFPPQALTHITQLSQPATPTPATPPPSQANTHFCWPQWPQQPPTGGLASTLSPFQSFCYWDPPFPVPWLKLFSGSPWSFRYRPQSLPSPCIAQCLDIIYVFHPSSTTLPLYCPHTILHAILWCAKLLLPESEHISAHTLLAWEGPPPLHPWLISPHPLNKALPEPEPKSPSFDKQPHKILFFSFGALSMWLLLLFCVYYYQIIQLFNVVICLYSVSPSRLWVSCGQEQILLAFASWAPGRGQLHRCVIYAVAREVWEDAIPGLMLCCYCLKILNFLTMGSPHLFFELGPANYVVGPATSMMFDT